jgi:hypothetical protein
VRKPGTGGQQRNDSLTHTDMRTHMHTNMHAHTCIRTHAHTCIHTCAHMHKHMHAHTCIHTCVHTCTHTCTYMHMRTDELLCRSNDQYLVKPQVQIHFHYQTCIFTQQTIELITAWRPECRAFSVSWGAPLAGNRATCSCTDTWFKLFWFKLSTHRCAQCDRRTKSQVYYLTKVRTR